MRSLDQSAIFHVWVREITEHLSNSNVKHISENTIKQVVLHTLGNRTEVFGVPCIMSTTKYKRSDEDLTDAERKAGIISMTALLSEMQAWSAREINLELTSPNEEKAA